ncbi:MAG: hypothetical protein IJA38_00820 [Bacteroidales bacterium]|nr:hypothetical protein [Bacteroidales bacterium]
MKRIFSFLFAIITLVGTTGVFTSCQEDAPEINYTINITVNNDFTEVVNAINNGTMKQEAAIAALTAAIEKMNGDQAAKLQALIDAVGTMATTLEAKLAIIEAAMKAQTLALENKLALLEAAIKALPDYTDQLKAIEAAIKGMPDYSDKLAAIETAIKNIPDYSDQITALEAALEAIADNIEAQEGQYADELAALKASIDDITKAVEAGNKSQEEALAEIIALLESGAIAGGGSGSGSGGEGSGGEGEDTTPYIAIDPLTDVGDTFSVTYLKDQELPELEGLELLEVDDKYEEVKHVTYKFTDVENVKLKGNITWIRINAAWIYSVDCTHMSCLEYFGKLGGQLTELDVSKNKNLKEIDIFDVNTSYLKLCPDVPGGYKKISCAENYFDKAAVWDVFFGTLPTASESEPGKLFIWNYGNPSKENEEFHIKPTDAQIKKAIDKNYKVYKDYNCTEEYVPSV